MSLPDPRGHEEYAELAAGWSLHSLEPDDETRFAAHLSDCATCQRAVEEYRVAVGDLSLLAPAVEPPPHLGDRIRAEVARDAEPARPAVVPLRRRWTTKRWLAAAAALVALALGVGNVVQYQQGRDAQREATALRAEQREADRRADLLGKLLQPGMQMSTLTPIGGGEPAAYVLVDDGAVQVLTTGLDRNDPATERYVLWMVGDGGNPKAMAAFDVAHAGVDLTSVGRLPSVAGGIDSFAVSIEPKQDALPARPTNVMAQGKAVS